MVVSARIFAAILLLSAVVAGPAGGNRDFIKDDTKDLNAESSEIIAESVAAPTNNRRNIQTSDDSSSAADQSSELFGDSQSFFPSFANFFEPRQNNNYRLGFGSQERAYSQRPNSYRSLLNYPLFSNYKNFDGFNAPKQQNSASAAAPLVDASNSGILGSGNFGIIRGGTFLAQNDEEADYDGDGFSSFYNNGHGRPSVGVGYIANPRPNYNQDQFANFRDFADINTPSNSAYSHFVVVYANKNATADEVSEETRKVVYEPKNIFETLELLDKSEPEETVIIPPKISKAKAKLAATKDKMQPKKYQWKKVYSKPTVRKEDAEDPLVALS